MRVINQYFIDNWKTEEVVPIMSVFILVLNLYAHSATESQVIILNLILSFISIHHGWCIIYFKTVQFCEFYLVKHSTVCNNVF